MAKVSTPTTDVAISGMDLPSPKTFEAKDKPCTDIEAAASVTASEGAVDRIILQKWNSPSVNIMRTGSVVFAFFTMGMSDGSIGIERDYGLSYTVVSVLFLSPCLGYLIAGLVNNHLHYHFGQFGVAALGPLLHTAGFLPLVFHPPYPVLPVAMFISGLGSGVQDSAWNAWAGNMQNSNELLGIIHGVYGLGGTVGPLIATAMLTKADCPWWYFFYLMLGFSAIEIPINMWAFWGQSGRVHRESMQAVDDGLRVSTKRILSRPLTWLISIFLLGYVGVEISLGGWITTFMMEVRHAEPFLAGISTTFYWLGITLGRFILGFATSRIGEKLAITIYLSLCILLQIMYWQVPSIPASIVFIILMGFFLGPLFPAAIVATTKLLSKNYHVGTIGVASAAGGCGGALLPFAVGALAQSRGISVLQVVALVILIFITCVWVCVPGGFHKGGLEEARDNNHVPGQEVINMYRRIKASTWFRGKRVAVEAK
ncbi:hypothetical protein BROUX41_006700 [Berkeleyomyces rouxiae]